MNLSSLDPDALTDPRPVVFGLPGGGISPAVFAACGLRAARMVPVDWMALPAAADPVSVADALAGALQSRAAARSRWARAVSGIGQAPGPGPTVLAGHSIGGVIAMLCAIRHPEHVQGLVISNTGPRIDGHGDPDLPARIQAGWRADERREFLASCFGKPPPDGLQTALDAYLAAIDVDRFLDAVIGLRRIDLTDDLASIRCPVLIAHGRQDRRRQPAAAEALVAGIPDATLVWLPAGHTPMVDASQAWADAVDAFLAARVPGAAVPDVAAR